MRKLAQALEEILRGTGDYISHLSALWLHGLTSEPPDPITIVSSGRRRSRTFGSWSLRFVYHLPARPRDTLIITCEGVLLRVASLEQAMIDLMTDLAHAPEQIESGRVLADLPVNLPNLIVRAADSGDAVCKRIIFWAIWSGRLGWNDLPFHLSRTPVVLEPLRKGGSSGWAGILPVRFSLEYLGLVPPGSSEGNDWLELLQYLPFRAFLLRMGWFPIRDDPRPSAQHLLVDFCQEEFNRALQQNLEETLGQVVPWAVPSSVSGHLPQLVIEQVRQNEGWLRPWEKRLVPWVRQALGSTDPQRLALALWLAGRLGLQREALRHLPAAGRFLYQSGRGDVVFDVCQRAEEAGETLPIEARVVQARFLIRDERLAEALSLIEGVRATRVAMPLETRVEAELAYLCGLAHRQARRFHAAEQELLTSQRLYKIAGDEARLLAVEMALGNLDLVRGRLSSARQRYLASLTRVKCATPTSAEANLLFNLGLLEYRACRFEHAVKYLQRSRERFRFLSFPVGETVNLITLGKIGLLTGNPVGAITLFQKARKIQSGTPGGGHPGETSALLAWANELLGRSGPAMKFWREVPEIEAPELPPRLLF